MQPYTEERPNKLQNLRESVNSILQEGVPCYIPQEERVFKALTWCLRAPDMEQMWCYKAQISSHNASLDGELCPASTSRG